MHQPRSLKSKIKTLQELRPLVREHKAAGRCVVFTNGCFDIIHAGHAGLLQEAREQGDVLVLAVNSDSSVRTIKGSRRPIVPQQQRLEVAAALESVDYVVAFDEPDPLKLIEALVPQVLVKGGDWRPEQIIGRDVVEQAGGRIVSISLKYDASTTDIINKVLAKNAPED